MVTDSDHNTRRGKDYIICIYLSNSITIGNCKRKIKLLQVLMIWEYLDDDNFK